MKIVHVQQGTPEWVEHRAKHCNASDAPAMLGISPYKSRRDILKEYALGLVPEVTPEQQAIFNRGHRAEALARPLAELIVGEELYPVTGVSACGIMSASFDGLTLTGEIAFEHKLLASRLREAMFDGCTGADLPEDYRAQMEQQILVSGAKKVLFMASDWDGNGQLIEERHCWYEPDQSMAARIVAGWEQFEKDIDAYTVQEVESKPSGHAPDSLPALRIELQGMVTASNLDAFKTHAMSVLSSINRELVTDQDFADAEQTVKWAKSVEDKLDAAKSHALSQTADIDALFRTIDDVSAETRRIRLELDKLVKAEKERRKADIVASFVASVQAHYAGISGGLPEAYTPCIQFPQAVTRAAMAEAVKGKRTLDSMTSACDSAAAALKIEASQQADRIRACIAVLEQNKDHATLFADRVQLCATKQPEDLKNLVAARIAEHEKQEAERVARIEREALEKARREVEAKAHAEAIKKAAELQKSEQKQTADEVIDAIVTYDLITLDDVNERLSPILITDTAFARLGYNSSISEAQFQNLCAKLHNIITVAQTQKGAA